MCAGQTSPIVPLPPATCHFCSWLQMAQPPAAAEAPPLPWPCERMCHSLTALPDGRLLVFGGRNKEGICRDMWLLDMVRHCWDFGAVGMGNVLLLCLCMSAGGVRDHRNLRQLAENKHIRCWPCERML
jgi:hypothetical protein